MTINFGAEEGLRSFITALNPGYALLVDGPWGSGKTHFVKRVCGSLLDPSRYRYITLNGVTDSSGFRRALLAEDANERLGQAASSVANTLGKLFKVEDLGVMAERAIEQAMLRNLPDVLIFDDLERTSLSAIELVGLLSAFVDQEGKKVILLAATDEHPDKDDFRKRKDKIIGRTLTIQPDFEEAFPSFVQRVSDAKVRDFLIEKRPDVFQVFNDAGYNNLRLLRNSIVDFGMVAQKIEQELFGAQEAMARLMRTYLALHMAFGKGDISKEDLQKRADWKVFRPDESKEISTLRKLHTTHEGADILAIGGSVMSVECGTYLLSSGHLDEQKVNSLLKDTGQFGASTEENPLWRRLIHWGRSSWKELDDLINEGLKYLNEANPIEPGPFLQISETLLRVADFGGLSMRSSVLKKSIQRRIALLRKQGGIPEAKLGIGLGWGMLGGTFSYGGYAVEPTPDFLAILKDMEAAQVSAYQKTEAKNAQRMLEIFARDLSEFKLCFTYQNDQPTFYKVPIMHLVDVARFAEVAESYLVAGRVEELGDVLELLAERHNSNSGWDQERKWFQSLRTTLQGLARARSKAASAHLTWFFRFHWKFQPPPKPTAAPGGSSGMTVRGKLGSGAKPLTTSPTAPSTAGRTPPGPRLP